MNAPTPESIAPPRYLIVADDLTGACDAAVAFAQRGAQTQVMLGETISTNAEVCALCTESRHLPAELAMRKLHTLAQAVGKIAGTQVFKKIDSVFRGNTFHEIRAIIDAFPGHLAVIAPAYPAVGRFAHGGLLHVHDLSGERSVAVRDGLRSVGLLPRWIAPGLGASAIARRLPGSRIVFCDALQQSDLEAVVEAATSHGRPMLWIGSAGLAHALATAAYQALRSASPLKGIRPGHVLAFIGSDHPVTLRQLDTLRNTTPVSVWPSDSTQNPESTVIVPIDCANPSPYTLHRLIEQFSPQTVSCLFMTGGDTALHVCRELGISALQLRQEFEPGIPEAAAIGGPFAGCNVILKSGGFGEAGVIQRITTRYSRQEAMQ
jgi:uncharacterized protein YgbK (DUF1537 family)